MLKGVFFAVTVSTVVNVIYALDTYEDWSPQSVDRTDLKCPIECKSRRKCCTCRAVPDWRLDNPIKVLQVEYTRRGGSAFIVDEDDTQSRLVHRHGFLSSFPKNFCSFNIVEIDLRHNFIDDIWNISCLTFLDTLDLSFNSISIVKKNILTGLAFIRVLNLNNNNIKTIEPFALAGPNISLFWADISFNKLTKIDISNGIPEHRFCEYDVSNNKIVEIVNEENFKLDVNKVYHGGFVNMNSNFLTKFFDWKDMGISDIRALGKLLQFGFLLQDMQWDCDCRMEKFLELTEDAMSRIWRDYYNVTCWNPPEYRGLVILDYFVKRKHLDLLICNLSTSDKCPKDCYCYTQPRYDRTVVNCTGSGLTALPDYVPVEKNLTLIFKNNNIQVMEDREYFNRSYSIDLSNNSIQTISEDAFQNMKTDVSLDLTDNQINELPRDIQTFDPCATPLGKLTMLCDCSHIWLTDWVKNRNGKDCSNTTDIFCQIKGKIMSVTDIDWDKLCTEDKTLEFLYIIFVIIFTLVIGLFILSYTFRYEMFILSRQFTKHHIRKNYPTVKCDVFISFSEDDDTIRKWAIQFLDSFLRSAGYKTFIPCRDEVIGINREESLINKINCSKSYIVILCERYSTEDAYWTTIEWKHIWNNFRENKEKQIIILNYDQVDSFNLENDKIKAFLRVGSDIDFSNRKHRLLQDVKKRLGYPLHSKYKLTNARRTFIPKALSRKDVFTLNI